MTLELILQYGSPVITMILGWLIGLKLQKAQVKSTELENVQQAITIWRETAEELKEAVRERDTLLANLQKSLTEMQVQIQQIMTKCQSNCFDTE